MDIRAALKYIRISPRKLQLVADVIRGKHVDEAQMLLTCCNKKGASLLKKLLTSAVSNAANTGEMDVNSLKVKAIFVDKGPRTVRYMPRAMGRANKIIRPSSHATVILSDY